MKKNQQHSNKNDENEIKNLSFYIKKYRKLKKFTQKDLGDLIGLSYGAIASWENGLHIPSADKYLMLLQLFKESDIEFDQEFIFQGFVK